MTDERKMNENEMLQNEGEIEIDLLALLSVFWRKKWLLLIGCIVGAVIGFFGTQYLVAPQYEARSMIYIFSKTTSLTNLTNLQAGNKLAADFKIMATTRRVIEETIEELNLNMSYEGLVGRIKINNPEDSRIMQITVRDTDPQMAANISNKVSEKLREYIADVMNTDEPSVVEEAIAPKKPVNSNAKRNAMLGGVLVVLVMAVVLVVLNLMDDTLKDEEDVEKYLGQTVLAVFPIDTSMAKDGKKTGKTAASKAV